jgi:hypothetical protein
MAIESVGLIAVTEKGSQKLAVKAGGKVKATAGTKYLLQAESGDIAPENITATRVGNDMHLAFEGSDIPDLIVQDFYAAGMEGELYGVAENGLLYAFVRTDGDDFGTGLVMADGETTPLALGGEGVAYTDTPMVATAGFPLWPLLAGLAVAGVAAAIIHHNRDKGHHHDSVPPGVPAAELAPASDSGIKGDRITNITTPTIEGKTEPGATVEVTFPTGEVVTTTADANGNWSVKPTQPLPEGPNDITVIAIDPAGNHSDPGHLPIVIDTKAPPADAWLDPASDSGIKGDSITSDTTPTIDGKTEPGATVEVTFPTGEVVTTTADANGDWSVKPTQALPDGKVDIIVIATDVAGNKSEPDHLPLVIDTKAPPTDAWLDPASDSGIKGDGITNDNTPTIDGKTEPGATVEVTFPTGEVVTTTADANGDWSVKPTQALPDGKVDITVIATDVAGNKSAPGHLPLVIDTKAPPTDAWLDPASDSGIKGDSITNVTTPSIDGKTEPNALVEVTFPTGEVVTTTANANGDWSVKPTQALPDGKVDITVIATDVAGNKSKPGHLPLGIDTKAPPADAWLDPASDSGIKGDDITNDNTPTIDGKTEPNALVEVTFPTGEVVTTTANANGDWSVKPTQALPDGKVDITVVATDVAGNKSAPGHLPLVIDTKAPPTDAWLDPASDSGIKGDSITNVTTPTIDGKTEPNALVEVTFPTGEVLTTTADANGDWSVKPSQPLPEGVNDIIAVATDLAGNKSDPGHLPITIDTTGPNAHLSIDPVTSDNIINTAESKGYVAISGTVTGEFTPGDKVSFTLAGTVYSAAVGVDGKWSVDVPGSRLVENTSHEIDATLIAHDVAGNAGTVTESHSYDVKLNSISITSMSKDTAIDLAHAGDFITSDGSAGRGVYGQIDQTLTAGQKIQISTDGGVTWKDAITNGLNWTFVDTSSHTTNWLIQARILEYGVSQVEASKLVSYVSVCGAPTITSIPDSVGGYTDTKAADGADVNVSLAGTNAKAGDTLHIIWGDTTYDQLLTAADIAADSVTAKVPAQQTITQGGQWDFQVTAQIVMVEGQMTLPSNAVQIQGQGWSTLAIDDLNRNVTGTGKEAIYQGGGITITSYNDAVLAHAAAGGNGKAGLAVVGHSSDYAQINFTIPVSSFSVNISGLDDGGKSTRVVVYDIKGNVLSDSMVVADGTGGISASAQYNYTAPVGTDIGKVLAYCDDNGGVHLDTLKFTQIHHAPGYNDSFTGDAGQSATGAGYHSDEGHFTVTAIGTLQPNDGTGWFNQMNLDGPYLYIGSGSSPMNNSAAIFTFDQPVKSFGYNLWGVEITAGNGSWLEVYDTDGSLIFNRFVTNNGGTVWNYEQVAYTAPEGISIGKVIVYQDANGTLLDNFYTVLAPDAPSGQMLIDHNWETYFDEFAISNAVVWHGQSFGTLAYSDKSSLANFHSESGGFTITGNAVKQASGSVWQNATAGSMYVNHNQTAVVTFDSARSKIEVGATGIERGNTAYLKVFDTNGVLLTTIDMTNPNGQYDIQTYAYEAQGNQIGHIEITGDAGGTHIMSVSSSETQITAESDVISMAVDPAAYFAQDSAHVFGSNGLDTLKLTGKDQVLDLTTLTGDSGAAKISSIEKFDITGTGDNTLKISLNDVLHLGETDMFQKDGKVQVMVDGDAGDKVQLANLHDHGTAPGTWLNSGTTTIGGSTYQVYSYSNLDAEVLIKQAVTASIV